MRGGFRRFTRSAGARLAFAYAGLFGASALILIIVLWSATLGLLNGQVDAAIRADALGLAERWRDGGARSLLATIDDRLKGRIDDDAIYLVLDPTDRTIAGNLAAWPAEVAEAGPIYEVSVTRHGKRSLARLHRYKLPGGYSLLVGRDVASRAALRELLTHTLAWALLLIIALSLGGAAMVQRLFRRMLSHVSETAAAISAGDLSPRVRLSGRGDEFDRLAETINDMLDRIGRLMDGVRQVSNAIAHDLRTPITRARARLENAAERLSSPDELRTEIRHAIDDLDGITAVFQALLRISEIEAGARRSAFAMFDLIPVVLDVVDLYDAVADERGVTVTVTMPDCLQIFADRELIQQALANLMDNALKFSPANSEVLVTCAQTGSIMHLIVKDEGPGIPAHDVGRATERFFRGERARSTPGFGLGLTLVRAVAHLHNGTISLTAANPGLQAELALPVPSDIAGTDLAGKRLPPVSQHEDVAMSRLGRV